MVLSFHLLTTLSTATLTQGLKTKEAVPELTGAKYILNADSKQVAFIKT